MKKNIIISIFSLLFLFPIVVFSQTLIPQGTDNWLSGAGTPGSGDVDGLNVVFFEIPDTVTGPIYFAIEDPGIVEDGGTPGTALNPQDQWIIDAGERMTFTLVGGDGAFSNPVSRKYKYSTKADVYSSGTGIQLDQHIYTPDAVAGALNPETTGWIYFNPVYPSQGEHIGNKYYFKVIAEASTGANFKNGYRFDASLSNAGSPTGISGGEAFAYSWCVLFRDDIDDSWDLYPYVTRNAVPPVVRFIVVGCFDFDPSGGVPTAAIYNKEPEGVPSAITVDGPSNEVDNGSVEITAGEDNGTWRVRITETGSVGYPNTSEVWAWENGAAENGNTVPDESTDTMYRIYSGSYNPPDPHHIVAVAEDGTAIDNDSDTEKITFQVVDDTGTPLPYSEKIWIDLSSYTGVTIVQKNNNADIDSPTAVGANTTLVTTDVSGIGWITIKRTDQADSTVTVTPVTNGGNSSSTLPGTNTSADVFFGNINAPTISSAGNNDENISQSGTPLENIVITETGTGVTRSLVSGANIRIKLPSVLTDSVFSAPVPTATPSGGGFAGVVTIAGNVITVPITGNFANGDTLTLSGITADTGTVTGSGKIILDYDGSLSYLVEDDKATSVKNPNLKEWLGSAGTGWNTPGNWSGGSIPVAGQDVVIRNVLNQPVLDIATTPALTSLTIDSGSTLSLNGNTLQATTFENQGTLKVSGGETVTNFTLDTDSGTVEYSGTGNTIAAWGNYYDLVISGGTRTLSGAVVLGGSLTISTGGTLNSSNQGITLAGNWNNSGTFVNTTSETVTFQNNSVNSIISGSTSFYNLAVPSAAAGKTILFEDGSTQTVRNDISINGTSGNEIILKSTNPGTQWTIQNDTSTQNISYINVTDSNVTGSGGDLLASSSTNGGNNDTGASPAWNFNPVFTWTGGGGASWNTPGSWDLNTVPVFGSTVVIPDVGTDPVLAGAVTVNNLTIQNLGILSLNGNNLTVSNTFDIQNNGTLRLIGSEASVSVIDTNNGTIEYIGGAAGQNSYTGLPTAASPHNHLIFNDTTDGDDIWALGAALNIGGNLTVTTGSFDLDGNNLATVTGTFLVDTNGQLTLIGNETVAVINTNNGTINYKGAAGVNNYPSLPTAASPHNHVIFNDIADGNDTWTLGAGLNIGGNLSRTAGNISAGANAVSVAGNIIYTAGTLTSTGLVTLNGTAAQSVNFTNATLTDLTLNATGPVTAGSAISLSGTLTRTAGNLAMGANALTVGGDVSYTAGTLTSTGLVTLNGTAAQSVNFTNATLADLTLNATGPVTAAGPVNMSGTLTRTAGNLAMGANTLTVGGDVSYTAGTLTSTGLVTLNGTAAQSVNFTNATLTDLILNATGPVTAGSAISLSGTLSRTAGNLAMGANTLTVGGDVSYTAGTLTSTGLVILNGIAAQSVNFTNATLTDLTLNATGPVTAAGPVNMSGTLSRTAGNLAMGANALTVGGDVSYTAGTLTSTGLVTLNGTAAQSVNFTNATLANLTINSTGPVTAGSAISMSGTLSRTAGNLAMGANNLTVGGDIIYTAGSLTCSGTLILNGAVAQAIDLSNTTLTNMTVNKTAGTATVSTAVTLSGTLTRTAGNLAMGANALTVGGDVSYTAGTLTSTGLVTLNGTAAQSVNFTNATLTDLTLNATGPVTAAGPVNMSGTLTRTAGNLAMGANTLTVGGDVSYTAGTLTSTGLVTLNGTAAQSVNFTNATLTDLTLNATGPVTAGSAISLSGTLSRTAGNLAMGANTLTVGGDVSYTAGTLTSTGLVTLNGTAAQSVNFTNATLTDLTLNATGPVTAAGPVNMSGTLIRTAGNLAMGANALTVGGDVSYTAGTLTSTGLVTLNGTAAQSVNFTNATLTDLTLNATGPVTATGPVNMSGTLSRTAGNLAMGANALTVGGDVSYTAGTLTSTGLVTLNGTAAQSVNFTNATLTDLTLNATGPVTAAGPVSMGGTLTRTAGNLAMGANALTVGGDVSYTAGTLTSTGLVTLNGTAAQSVNFTNATLNDLTLNATGPVTAAGPVSMSGTLSRTAGNLAMGANNLTVGGDIIYTAGSLTCSGTLILNGAVAQAIDLSNTTLSNMTVNKTAGTATVSTAVTLSGTLTRTAGNLAMGANALTVGGDVSYTAGTLTSTGLVTLNGTAAQSVNFTNATLTDLTLNATGPVTAAGPINMSGTLTRTAGNLAMGANALTVGGDVSYTAGTLTSTGLVTLNGTAAQSVNFTNATLTDLTLNATGPVTAAGPVNMSGTLTRTAGNLVMGANALTVGGDVSYTAGTLTSTGLVTLNGTAAQSVNFTNATLTDLTLNATGPVTAAGPVNMSGTLTRTAGNLAMGANALTVGGDVSYTAGTLTSTGVVTLNGTAAQSVNFTNTTLTDLTLNATGPVTAGSAISLSGTLTRTAGNLVMGANALTVGGDVSYTAGTLTSTGLVTLNGTAAQSVNFTNATLTDLTLNATGPVTAAGPVNMSGTLTRTAGNLAMGGNSLTVGTDIVYTAGMLTSTGTVFLNGAAAQAVNFTSTTLTNMTVNKTAGTATLGSAVSLSGNLIINNAGIFDQNNFNMNVSTNISISAGGLSTGAGRINCGGNWTAVAGAVFDSGTGIVIFDGAGAQSLISGGADGNHDFYNIVINKGGGTLSVSTNELLTRNFFHFAGTLDISNRSIRTTGDFAAFGGAYTADDGGTADIFKYNPAPAFIRPAAVDAASAAVTALIDEEVVHSAAFANLDGATIRTDRNFYINGADMPSTVNWTLQVRDNKDGLTYFAEVYNSIVDNSQVAVNPSDLPAGSAGNIAAAENVTANLCSAEWRTVRTSIVDAGTYTVFDDIIRVQFSEAIENTNNEISAAVGDIFLTAFATPFTGTFTDAACTISTDTVDDINTFYLQITTNPWNTDAKDLSSGAAGSTDRDGTVRGNIPQIHFRKHLAGLYYTLRDQYKNRLGTTSFQSVDDQCKPVLYRIDIDRQAHAKPITHLADGHNLFRLYYSEPVHIGTDIGDGTDCAAGFSIAAANAANQKSGATFAAAGEYGGALSIAAGTVSAEGYFSYGGGAATLNKGFRYGDVNNEAVYRPNSHQLEIYLSGWNQYASVAASNAVDSLVPPYNVNDLQWPGLHWGVSDPKTADASLSVTANSRITDADGNSLDESVIPFDFNNLPATGFTVNNDWDIDEPKISLYKPGMTHIFPLPGFPATEVYVLDNDSNDVIDRLEFHIHDNSSDEGIDGAGWNSSADHPDQDLFYDTGAPADILPEGVRDFTVKLAMSSFFINRSGTAPVYPASGYTFSTEVSNTIFEPLPGPVERTAGTTASDMYFTLSLVNEADLGLTYLDQVRLTYDEVNGSITDLAGNRLTGLTNVFCIEQVPPVISYSLASTGGRKIFVRFSKYIYGPGGSGNQVTAAAFQVSGTPVTLEPVIQAGDQGILEAFLVMPATLSAELVFTGVIQPQLNQIFDSTNTVQMATTSTHKISDIGIRVIEPVWADDGVESETIQGGGALKVFDGTGRLHDSDITLQAGIQSASAASLPSILYFDVNPPSSAMWNDFWLPGVIKGFNENPNNSVRGVSAYSSQGALRNFIIPSNDSEIKPGATLEFLLRLGGLYCSDVRDPDDPRTLIPWKVKITGVKKQRAGVTILNNVINPLEGEKTVLQYDLEKSGAVTINIFSLSGDVVQTLFKGRQAKGSYSFTWDGKNTGGRAVARGIYFIRIVGPDVDEYRKVMVVK